MPSAAEKLAVADVFADDSENDRTFNGFSDSEIDDHWVSHFSLKALKVASRFSLKSHKLLLLTEGWSLVNYTPECEHVNR